LPCSWNLQLSDHSEAAECLQSVSTIHTIHWNSPNKLNVQAGLPNMDFFRTMHNMFLEFNGNLLRRPLLKCVSANVPTSSVKLSDSEKVASPSGDGGAASGSDGAAGAATGPASGAGSLSEDGEMCAEIRAASRALYRTYVNYVAANVSAILPNEITLVTQTSYDRVHQLETVVDSWPGPLSISLYVTDMDVHSVEELMLHSRVLSERRNSALHFVFRSGPYYPVNYMRNVALREVKTDYAFLVDIDFIASPGGYADLVKLAARHVDERTALIVPAFETLRYKFKFPKSKEDLFEKVDRGEILTFRSLEWVKGHAPTDFQRLRFATDVYQIEWAEEFEPYVVVRKDTVPLYDERFMGFGWNKVCPLDW
jgi:glycosyltransferase-like protein LARGE